MQDHENDGHVRLIARREDTDGPSVIVDPEEAKSDGDGRTVLVE